MGIVQKDGDDYVMDARYADGLVNVNGAPMPLPVKLSNGNRRRCQRDSAKNVVRYDSRVWASDSRVKKPGSDTSDMHRPGCCDR